MTELIPESAFGEDHWSLLSFMETIAVEEGGRIDEKATRRMRTFKYGMPATAPTRLTDGKLAAAEHDDWACLSDLSVAGYVNLRPDNHTGYIFVTLTDAGWNAAGQLRRLRAENRSAAAYHYTPDLIRNAKDTPNEQ